jgi:hypothetical protein
MGFIRQRLPWLPQFYVERLTMPPMKKLSTLNAFTTHPLRGIGLIAAIALFSLAVFRLVHLPAASMDHDFLDLWRGLAVGSLYLLFCLSTDHRSHSDF